MYRGQYQKLHKLCYYEFNQLKPVYMAIKHYHIVTTETVVITINVTIFLHKVMLMRALCLKSFIQIIFRRNMLLGCEHCYLFSSRYSDLPTCFSPVTPYVTLIDTVIDMGEICTIWYLICCKNEDCSVLYKLYG